MRPRSVIGAPPPADPNTLPAVERLLCQLLAGRTALEEVDELALDDIWALATFASVDELLADIIVRATKPPAYAEACPETRLHERAVARLHEATVREMLRARELRRIWGPIVAAGVRCLLMKGAGLAYTVYPEPRLRPAGDVDLFIERGDLERLEMALREAGYRRRVEPDAEAASMQRHYARAEAGIEHCVDVHWRVSNRHVFADAVPFARAWDASIGVTAFPGARTLGAIDALLLACLHRVAHHDDHGDLLWLWDIHLLAIGLSERERTELLRTAGEARMRAVVAHGLALARDRFATAGAASLVDQLRAAAGDEPSARFLERGRSQAQLVASDLAVAGSLATRARIVREHLFPGIAYMRAQFPRWPAPLLPFAYVYRIARGAPRWLR
jgi:hypothetical protein